MHVHAPFALNPDRTSVVWSATSSQHDASQGNRAIAQDTLPQAMLAFLSDLVRVLPIGD